MLTKATGLQGWTESFFFNISINKLCIIQFLIESLISDIAAWLITLDFFFFLLLDWLFKMVTSAILQIKTNVFWELRGLYDLMTMIKVKSPC